MPNEYKSFYATAGGEEGSRCVYPTRLDTYGCGCQHDCSYCYARSLLDFRGLWHPEDPSVADIAKVRRKVAELNPGDVVRMGGMTDCLAPVEKKHGVTYETIQALNERGVHQLIVTKSPLISDDRYMAILDPKLSHVQITVTSTDDAKAAEYEKAARPSERFAAIQRLQNSGFDVQLRLSPYIPENVDLDMLASYGIDKVLVEFLRVNHWVYKWMRPNMDGYRVNEGGYRHLTLRRKKQLLGPVQEIFKEVSVCEDVDAHYQHFVSFVNNNPKDCCNLRIEE